MPLQISSFAAWVTVDGVELPQYAVETAPDGKQATCWIPSMAQKKFRVSWKDSSALFTTRGRVWVDGYNCGTRIIDSGPWNQDSVKSRSYVRVSESTCRSLLFAKPTSTDDDRYLDVSNPEDIGKIVLKVYKSEILSTSPVRVPFQWSALPDASPIHERAKKALGHQLQFGQEKRRPFLPRNEIIRDVELLCTFVFNYRPLEILQAQRLAPLEERVPNSPSPVVGPSQPRHGDLRRINELKREPEQSERRRAKRVKRETNTATEFDVVEREIIDLT